MKPEPTESVRDAVLAGIGLVIFLTAAAMLLLMIAESLR